jgi:hypothetical protein
MRTISSSMSRTNIYRLACRKSKLWVNTGTYTAILTTGSHVFEFVHIHLAFLLQDVSGAVSTAERIERLGVIGILILGYVLLFYGLMSSKIITGPRFREMESYYKDQLGEEKKINEEYRREAELQHRALERLTEEYKNSIRDIISLGIRLRSGDGDQ